MNFVCKSWRANICNIDGYNLICYESVMNANIVMTSADDFQLLQRQLAVAARSQSLARAEASARAMVRVLDKAATLAALKALRAPSKWRRQRFYGCDLAAIQTTHKNRTSPSSPIKHAPSEWDAARVTTLQIGSASNRNFVLCQGLTRLRFPQFPKIGRILAWLISRDPDPI